MSENKEELDQIITSSDINQNNNKTTQWRSCCITTDKNMIIYFSQMSITIIILVFSSIQLIKSEYDCNKSAPYLSLISFILGKLLSSISTTK